MLIGMIGGHGFLRRLTCCTALGLGPGLCDGVTSSRVRVTGAKDDLIQPESLILAQNERWRQA